MSEYARKLLTWVIVGLIVCAAVWASTDIVELRIGSLLGFVGTTMLRISFLNDDLYTIAAGQGELNSDEDVDDDKISTLGVLVAAEETETALGLNPYTGEFLVDEHTDISGDSW